MAESATKSTTPTDRLTRLCDAMSKALEDHPEHQAADRCIIMITTTENGRGQGGMVTVGYDDEPGSVGADLFMQLRGMLRAHGKDLHLVPVGMTPPDKRE